MSKKPAPSTDTVYYAVYTKDGGRVLLHQNGAGKYALFSTPYKSSLPPRGVMKAAFFTEAAASVDLEGSFVGLVGKDRVGLAIVLAQNLPASINHRSNIATFDRSAGKYATLGAADLSMDENTFKVALQMLENHAPRSSSAAPLTISVPPSAAPSSSSSSAKSRLRDRKSVV